MPSPRISSFESQIPRSGEVLPSGYHVGLNIGVAPLGNGYPGKRKEQDRGR